MRLAIVNGDIITGNGELILKNTSVIIQDGLIEKIVNRPHVYDYAVDKIIDAKEGYIIPGVINNHTHGIGFGPFLPSGAKPLTRERVLANLNRHMLQGETTLLNCDGFCTIYEVELANKLHPANVKAGTTHTSKNFEAADLCDGSGLQENHRKFTVEEMLDQGAVAIGEVGAGATFGGGVQDYYYIPNAVKKETGRDITSIQANSLKVAVLGSHIDPSAFDPDKVNQVLKEIGLEDILRVEKAKKLIMETTLPPVSLAKDGVREAGVLAKKHNVPMIVHNAAASMDVVYEVAKKIGTKMIAGHSDHSSFELSEALDHARRLKECGAIVDVHSSNFGARARANAFAILEEGLADTISTDFGGGYWKSILFVLEKAVEKGLVDLPRAIAMATSNAAKAIPRLAPNRGTIAPGKIADVVLVDKDKISKVDTVIISGIVTVEKGEIVTGDPLKTVNW